MQPAIRLLSTLALKGVIEQLGASWEAAKGAPIDGAFAPTQALLERLRAGDAADVVILTREGLHEIAAGQLVVTETMIDLVQSLVGIAVRAGAAHPDIATEQSLRMTLLAAGSVAYSRIGASGILFAQLIERLGIADPINARATIIPSGFTAARLISGEADLAVQQISELRQVAGIEVVGPIPRSLQTPAIFSAARLKGASNPHQADRLIAFLASAQAAPVLREHGLEPCA